MYEWHGYGGGMMWFFWVVFLVVVVLFLFSLVRRDGPGVNNTKTAREILEERYARGEITRDEFRQMRDDLSE